MNQDIALRMRVYRVYRNISQEKMAEALNFSRSKISSWESCRRDICMTDAIELSNYLKVSMDNLFNPKELSTIEFMEIAKRYFNNPKLSVEEKNYSLKKLYEYRTQGEVATLFESK